MSQDDINKDLGHYIKVKHKKEPFWKKFESHPKVEDKIKEDLEHAEEDENIAPEDKKEMEEMEHKIEEVDEMEEKVQDEFDNEREGLLKRFFKKLNFGSKKSGGSDEYVEAEETQDAVPDDEEMKEFLRTMHTWITKLDPETQKEFKESKDFEIYTGMLKKYNLIK